MTHGSRKRVSDTLVTQLEMAKIRVEQEEFSSTSGSEIDHLNGKIAFYIPFLFIKII